MRRFWALLLVGSFGPVSFVSLANDVGAQLSNPVNGYTNQLIDLCPVQLQCRSTGVTSTKDRQCLQTFLAVTACLETPQWPIGLFLGRRFAGRTPSPGAQ